MPNTLAHVGVQGVVTRWINPEADPKVIILGCLLPDVPWILQRLVREVMPGVDLYSLRAYCIVQASLLVTLLLCGALAVIARRPMPVFVVLSLNAFMHLVLDAFQTKWANGVHFFAPFSWDLVNFGWFWPENLPTYGLTLGGLGFIGWYWREGLRQVPAWPYVPAVTWGRLGWCAALVGGYFLLPVFLWDGPFTADNHFVNTLSMKEARVGKMVEFDRNHYIKGGGLQGRDVLRTFAGEHLEVRGVSLPHSGLVSVRARFVTPSIIEIQEIHEHSPWFRDGSSYVSIVLLMILWGGAWGRHGWKTASPA